ncbi:MAG: RelA/SpoT domain-containing protein [candidate division Zixibacteria bacterium]|nr:RelA/SpoT domain-containing protein [candidate division Zixibacteria bacterium]
MTEKMTAIDYFVPPDKNSIRIEYEKRAPLYKQLAEEMEFILDKEINKRDIKIHMIKSRIKEFDSFYRKIEVKECRNPFEGIEDICGVRIVCLYPSDLERIGKMIEDLFLVKETSRKVGEIPSNQFDYSATHYIVTLKSEQMKGPRYDDLRNLKCEVQVRTILTDAWASVSHHLFYKKDIDVPSDLKRDFYALMGLFYVADTHFELLKNRKEKMIGQLQESIEAHKFELEQELNLETLKAYLEWKFPDRKAGDTERDAFRNISYLNYQLQLVGYKTLQELDQRINKTAGVIRRDEEMHKKQHSAAFRFYSVGAMRVCMRAADENFARVEDELTKGIVKKR